jgi:hypothetical protein
MPGTPDIPRRSVEGLTLASGLRSERLKGIEPSSSVWKTEALPLSYSRVIRTSDCNIAVWLEFVPDPP